MRILVVSDSHGLTSGLADLKRLYKEKVDVMIHCGDSELTADDDEIKGFLTVRGNCDEEVRFPLDLIKVMSGNKIFVTHGHHYNVKLTIMNLSYKAKETGANFVFFGHSHMLGAEMIDDTLYLNPGSIASPRGSRKEKTYAIVEKLDHEVIIQFYNDKHEEIMGLRQHHELS